eukprot:6133688-Pleurochrysis_carterae.AAC.1
MPFSGDLSFFETHSRVVQSRLKPKPMLDMPTLTHRRAAELVAASYEYLNEGAEHVANSVAERFGAHLDTELSTQKGV